MVERGPNRYTADDWPVISAPESWRVVAQPYFDKLDESVPDAYMVAHALPSLAYRSIQEPNGYPTVRSDAQGQFPIPECEAG